MTDSILSSTQYFEHTHTQNIWIQYSWGRGGGGAVVEYVWLNVPLREINTRSMPGERVDYLVGCDKSLNFLHFNTSFKLMASTS